MPESEPSPQFRGVFIPAKIWRDTAISWMDKALLAEIDALDDGDGCYASNAHLAKMMGPPATEKSISNKIAQLRDAGYIVDRGFNGRRRFISVSYAPEAREARKALNGESGKIDASTREWTQHPPGSGGSIHPGVDIDTSTEKSGEARSALVPTADAADGEIGKKGKPAPSDQGAAFAAWFQTLLPERMRNQTAAQLADWGRCYDDLLRLDKRTKEDVVTVCEWARGDNFWKKNFFTPLKLRDKSDTAGVKFFDLFLERIPKQNQPKNGKTPNIGIPAKAGTPVDHAFTADTKQPKGGGLAALKAQRDAALQANQKSEHLTLPLS